MNRFAFLAACGLASSVFAQVKFNEVMINSPGNDQGNEYIELVSTTPNFDLSAYTIIVIEGDDNVAGVIDQVLPLSGKSTGANRLFLWRDGVVVLPPGPAAETNIFVQDFNPDLENGANNFFIVEGFSGTLTQDLDTDNDGVLDVTPWTRVVDAFGHREGNLPNNSRSYAAQFGGIDTSDPRGLTDGFTPDMFVRICDCAFSLDVLGAAPGQYFPDPAELANIGNGCNLDVNTWLNSPGSFLAGEDSCGGPACSWQSDNCFADYNNDDGIDGDDVIAFFADWDTSGACADVDNSDGVDGDDVIAFFASWDVSGTGFPGC